MGSLGFWDLVHAWDQHVESGVYLYRWFCPCMANSTDFLRFFLVVVTDCALIEPLLERQQKPWDSNGGIVSTWWMRRLFSSDLPSTVIGVAASQRQKGKDKLDLVFGPVAISSVYEYSEARLFVMYNDWHNAMSIMSKSLTLRMQSTYSSAWNVWEDVCKRAKTIVSKGFYGGQECKRLFSGHCLII